MGSLDSGTRPRRAMRGVPKHRPSRTQRRGRKRLRRRRRRSSEEEEEDSDEEMGECMMAGNCCKTDFFFVL